MLAIGAISGDGDAGGSFLSDLPLATDDFCAEYTGNDGRITSLHFAVSLVALTSSSRSRAECRAAHGLKGSAWAEAEPPS
jgi:hypothetical protein